MKVYLALLCMLPFLSMALDWQQEYRTEREGLSQDEVLALLDRGNELLAKTDLVNSLVHGGSALFPHVYIRKCGDQVAAVAQASLLAAEKSGKNQILVLGVLHPLTKALYTACMKAKEGIDVTGDPLRGIFGPDLPGADVISKEFSVESFLFLLHRIAELRGVRLPRVIVRYPNLIQGDADSLPGIEELRELAANSIVVATSDLCHHGAPYGTPEESRLPIGEPAFLFARETIQTCLDVLGRVDLLAYRAAVYEAKSDSVCVGQALSALLGPLKGKIQDLKLVDYESTFGEYPGPIWVAATLVELKP